MEKYYLATTGISKIWDLDSKLLLLGPWCLSSLENKKLLKNKNYIIVSSPWKPTLKIKEVADYCHNIYEELIPILSERMNFIHNVSYPEKYWRILIGPWLLHFIEVLYDRYKRIENVLKPFPDFYTHVLPRKECNTALSNLYDFVRYKINEDYYNLKLFSIIAYDLCADRIVENNLKFELKANMRRYSWKFKMFYNLTKPVLTKGKLVFGDMYHLNLRDIFLIKYKMGLNKVGFIDSFFLKEFSLNKYNYFGLRKDLVLKKVSSKFTSLLYSIIPESIPTCYMENYNFYRNYILSIKGIDKVRIIGSAVGWYFNEIFKFFAAEVASRNTKIVEFQHGGNFGVSSSVPLETIALERDIFYSWGWNSKNNNKIKSLPSIHLSKLKDQYLYKFDRILFIGNAFPKFHYRFHTQLMPDDMPKYFDDKKRFFQNLSREIINKTLYRPFLVFTCKEEMEMLKEIYPHIKFLLKGRLVEWMKRVKLVVIDHPHTSFLEALTINVPCVFYWDHDVYLIRDEAEEYFELLRKVDILYKDPESAANKVNEIYNNPLEWWLDDKLQKARRDFCDRYAFASRDWLEVWAKELNHLLTSYEKK